MRLLSISYVSNDVQKHALMLELGRRNDKVCGLYSSLMSDDDVRKIRNAYSALLNYPFEDRMRWCRDNIPSFNNAYREITEDKVVIEEMHEVK